MLIFFILHVVSAHNFCCADGTKEQHFNHFICGCNGNWSGKKPLNSPKSGSACGNSVPSPCISPADLCGPGANICTSLDWNAITPSTSCTAFSSYLLQGTCTPNLCDGGNALCCGCSKNCPNNHNQRVSSVACNAAHLSHSYVGVVCCINQVEPTFLKQVDYRNRQKVEVTLIVRSNLTMVHRGQSVRQAIFNERANSIVDYSGFSLTKDIVDRMVTVDYVHRPVYLINESLPGPILIVDKGTSLSVTVKNELMFGLLSIHWHGIQQILTNSEDGVARLTEVGIGPGQQRVYNFTVNAGTHWYHDHADGFRTDGVFGGLIVTDEYDEVGTILLLQDWFSQTGHVLLDELNNGGYLRNGSLYLPSLGLEGVEIGPAPFESALINGKKCPVFRGQTPEEGTLLRLIGAQSLYAFEFSVDNHILEVLASDGSKITPIRVDSVIIHTGERYDLKAIPIISRVYGCHTIRIKTLEQAPHEGSAHLCYDNINETGRKDTPTNRVANCPFLRYPFTTKECINIANMTTPYTLPEIPSASPQVFLNFAFSKTVDNYSAVNGYRFRFPSHPLNTSLTDCNNSLLCTQILDLPKDSTNVLVLTNINNGGPIPGGTPHPVHLHGYSFQVIKVGYPVYDPTGQYLSDTTDILCGDHTCWWRDEDWKEGKLITGSNWRNAPLKDTVIVPAGGYVVIGFKASNPGCWFMHCHIDIHQMEGMALIVRVNEGSVVCGVFGFVLILWFLM